MNNHKKKPLWKQLKKSVVQLIKEAEPTYPPHLPRLLWSEACQPDYVQSCETTQAVIKLLRVLDWGCVPMFSTDRKARERQIPLCAYIGAYLVKLEYGLGGFGQLYRYLSDHPGLLWALGFPQTGSDPAVPFNAVYSLPTQKHLTKKLGCLPNGLLQNLLDGEVSWFKEQYGESFGQVVSLDTKHILAWVKENNPKQYIKEGRFDKTRQPTGDSDCKLGCKRRRNQTTPTKEGQPASESVAVGEYYWGYASGAAVTKIPNAGEIVLAELTQTFDKGDATYFFPLMERVEARLGFRPPYGTADAAFDAFYVYDYFDNGGDGQFAAVPLRKTRFTHAGFDEEGMPLCQAKLNMALKRQFISRSGLVTHQRGVYVCPLLYPEVTGETCPIDHEKWPNGGCELKMPTATGARIRYQLDRESDEYKAIYKQRTAVERIFSQAVALGIERPKLRNRQAITNLNTLTYILINLRAMHRIEENRK